jgi:long-chain acyl-CoA synthetase
VTAFKTLTEMFLDVTDRGIARERTPGYAGMMQFKRDGAWHAISAGEVRRRVTRLSAELLRLGLTAGDRVAILSENSPEWAIADYACMAAGLVAVPIYPTLTADQTRYILNDSGSRAVFVSNAPGSNAAQMEKVLSMHDFLPEVGTIILMSGSVPARPNVLGMEKMYGSGPVRDSEDAEFVARCRAIHAEDLFSVLYTSGTTGTPKGVMLSHRNLASNILDPMKLVQETDVALSFLPLSHIFERMADYTFHYYGASVAYLANIDEVPQALADVRPTMMCAVPRFFEKLYGRVMEQVNGGPPLRRKLFWWAVGVGKRRLDAVLNRRPVPFGVAAQYAIADRLVFAKMRQRMGGRLRIVVSGSAPLARELAEFFLACGITLLEGYGLTETSPVLCANVPGAIRLGTVGKAIPGVELKIAEDGEILARGPNIMMGYYKRPEETAVALADGWFHTGDIGSLDTDGYLTITDRKKDLLKTAGGKFIAPQPIENKLKLNPFVKNVVVLGDRRKFVSALVVVDLEKLAAHAQEQGIAFVAPRELLANAQILEFMQGQVDQWTSGLAHFERIKKVLLVDHDFSIADGTLTPTLKARRAAIERQFKEQIDKLYETPM